MTNKTEEAIKFVGSKCADCGAMQRDCTCELETACGACGEFIEDSKHVCVVEMEYIAEQNEFSLGKVSALLARFGVKSEIMHTGGGCATLYCGDSNTDGYYPVVCGAGLYEPANPSDSIGWANDFFIGRDDDKQGEGFYYKGANDVNKIANVIFNYFMEDLENIDTCSHCSRYPATQGDICRLCAGLEG